MRHVPYPNVVSETEQEERKAVAKDWGSFLENEGCGVNALTELLPDRAQKSPNRQVATS